MAIIFLAVLVIASSTLARPDRNNNSPRQVSSQSQLAQRSHQQGGQQQKRVNVKSESRNRKQDDSDEDEGDDDDDNKQPRKKKNQGKLLTESIDPDMVRRVLQDEQKTSDMVDCVLYYQEGCPRQLERVHSKLNY